MKTSILTFLLICFVNPATAQQPPVLINELLFRPDATNSDPNRTYDWAELFNSGQAGVNLAGWKITAHDGASGSSARQLPSVILPAGKYLVVRFTSGTSSLDFSSGAANYYTGDNPAAPYWNSGSDEAALYSPSGIVDFIAWSRSDLTYSPGAAHNDAVKAGIWTAGTALVSDRIGQTDEMLRAVTPGTSIGRDSHSTDTNSPFDFDALGGRDASDITIGRQNLDFRTILNQASLRSSQSQVRPAAAPSQAAGMKKWTVMLYMNGANNTEKWFWLNLLQIALEGGSDSNINFVVLYGTIGTYLGIQDSSGKVISTSNLGGNFRGLMTDAYNPGGGYSVVLQSPTGSPALPAQDMGDPATLTSFVSWATQNYPASHYALILGAHGGGWKGFGPDERFRGSRQAGAPDLLYMGEFDTALSGFHFDLVAFNSCLMSTIEVAYQFRPFTDWFVASEQVMPTDPGLDFDHLATALKQNPQWNGSQLGTSMVDNYVNLFPGSYLSLALINEANLPQLVGSVDTFAKALRTGVGLTQMRDNPKDNPQILISNDAQAAYRFYDGNFMDLYDFAKRIANDPMLPQCVKTPAAQVVGIFDSGSVVTDEKHTADLSGIHGLSIYMPIFRSGGIHLIVFKNGGVLFNEPYDLPLPSRVTNGSSPIATYAPNHDLLPLLARDMETGVAIPAADWPAPPTPHFAFVFDTSWSRFLERYYHPVADNHIVKAIPPDGEPIYPVSSPGGQCSNTEDYITVPVGSTVYLSGAGSSDADMPPNVPGFSHKFDLDGNQVSGFFLVPSEPDAPASITPMYYIWDLTADMGCPGTPPPPGTPCLRPVDVAAGSDAAMAANTNMDEDRVPAPTNLDQSEFIGVSPTVPCPTPQIITTNLIPWDDNHLFSFHDTNPNAQYVHPQTDSQQSLIICLPPPVGLIFQDWPAHISVGDSFTDSGFAYGVSGTSSYRVNNYPMTVSITGGIAVSANGTTITGSTGGEQSGAAVVHAVTPNSVQVQTDAGEGGLQLLLSGTQTGPASITVHALGTNVTQPFNLNIEPKPSPIPTAIQVSASAPAAVGGTGTITAVVMSGAQPVPNAWVTFANAPNIFFTNGARFNTNHSTQVQTDSTGTAVANYNAYLSGAFTVSVSAGGTTQTVNTSVTGTPIASPSNFSLSGVPVIVQQGVPASITATVRTPVATAASGISVLFTVVTGSLTVPGSTDGNKTVTIKTDANGVATMNFTAIDTPPVQINVSVAGLGVQTVMFGVQSSGAAAPQPPTPTGVTPAAGSGVIETMTFTFADPRGYTDLGVVNILINNFLDGRFACYLAYSQPQNVLYLVNDTGTALLNGLVLNGSPGSVSNSQCTINSMGSAATGAGNGLTLTLNVTFGAGFAGNKVVYLAARDVVENNSGWVPSGVWQITGAVLTTTTSATGATPAAGAAAAQQYTFTFSDTKGYQDIGVVNVLVNDYLNGNKACYIAYSQPTNALYLVNDAGNGLLPAILLNGSGTLSNSQCTITGAGSSATGSGNSLALTLNISFASPFSGNRIFYLAVRDVNEANNTGWQSLVAWLVP